MSVSAATASVLAAGREFIEREQSAPPPRPAARVARHRHAQRHPIAQPINPNAPTIPTPAPSPKVSSEVAQPCKPQAHASVTASNRRRAWLRTTLPCRLPWIILFSIRSGCSHPVPRRNRRSECSQRERPGNGRITGGKTRPLTKDCADVSARRACRPLRAPGQPAFDRKCRFSHIPQWRALSCSWFGRCRGVRHVSLCR